MQFEREFISASYFANSTADIRVIKINCLFLDNLLFATLVEWIEANVGCSVLAKRGLKFC